MHANESIQDEDETESEEEQMEHSEQGTLRPSTPPYRRPQHPQLQKTSLLSSRVRTKPTKFSNESQQRVFNLEKQPIRDARKSRNIQFQQQALKWTIRSKKALLIMTRVRNASVFYECLVREAMEFALQLYMDLRSDGWIRVCEVKSSIATTASANAIATTASSNATAFVNGGIMKHRSQEHTRQKISSVSAREAEIVSHIMRLLAVQGVPIGTPAEFSRWVYWILLSKQSESQEDPLENVRNFSSKFYSLQDADFNQMLSQICHHSYEQSLSISWNNEPIWIRLAQRHQVLSELEPPASRNQESIPAPPPTPITAPMQQLPFPFMADFTSTLNGYGCNSQRAGNLHRIFERPSPHYSRHQGKNAVIHLNDSTKSSRDISGGNDISRLRKNSSGMFPQHTAVLYDQCMDIREERLDSLASHNPLLPAYPNSSAIYPDRTNSALKRCDFSSHPQLEPNMNWAHPTLSDPLLESEVPPPPQIIQPPRQPAGYTPAAP